MTDNRKTGLGVLYWTVLLIRPKRKGPTGGGSDWIGPTTEIRPIVDQAKARVNTQVGLTRTDITRPAQLVFSTRSLIGDFLPTAAIRRNTKGSRAITRTSCFSVSFSSLTFTLVVAVRNVPAINVVSFSQRSTEYSGERSASGGNRLHCLISMGGYIQTSLFVPDKQRLKLIRANGKHSFGLSKYNGFPFGTEPGVNPAINLSRGLGLPDLGIP
ncbi:hypothetical protein CRG98_019466 [Punica granatum]|uniref:Uncharacterized protein n=1 Tax=Punica granatum TaxID=22663 RepID=A0A2I0JV32_PUNGR|nr:hypothetical protein CRG98_019466 [Punica granatum]